MKGIFIYKDNIVDLSKVTAIEMEGSKINFYMDRDWEYSVDIEEMDTKAVKEKLLNLVLAR